MIQVYCRQCNYRRKMSERELEFGMLCPKCHCQNLKAVEKLRPENRIGTFRPVTVRSLIAGFACLILGPICIAMAWPGMGTRGAVLWARVFAFGILLLIVAVGSLITGFISMYKDLSE